jgi:mono/diheme cytochrome c family protein
MSDAHLARMLRHMVRHDGRAALPFMGFQNLSDDDVVAIISFLRAQPPVRNAVAPHDVTFLGKLVAAYLIRPRGPEGTPPAHTPAGPSVARGEYIVTAASDCIGCHTQRNPIDGSFTGPKLAGGGVLPVEGDTAHVFVTPNLTPDPRTGRIARWTEDQFVARFRAGKVYPKSHMPWGLISRASEDDLRSIYRYLQTVPPVVNATGESIQKRKA